MTKNDGQRNCYLLSNITRFDFDSVLPLRFIIRPPLPISFSYLTILILFLVIDQYLFRPTLLISLRTPLRAASSTRCSSSRDFCLCMAIVFALYIYTLLVSYNNCVALVILAADWCSMRLVFGFLMNGMHSYILPRFFGRARASGFVMGIV